MQKYSKCNGFSPNACIDYIDLKGKLGFLKFKWSLMSLEWNGSSPEAQTAQWLFCADLPCGKGNLCGSARGKMTTEVLVAQVLFSIAVHMLKAIKILAGEGSCNERR